MSLQAVNQTTGETSQIAGLFNPGSGGETYTAGDGINISAQNKISTKMVMFTGTSTEWEALSLAEKVKYTHTCFDDDEQTGVVDSVPTENSNHLVISGGVFDALEEKAEKSQISNPNLLDNPWFTVNQRGQSSYVWDTDIGYRYTVDRWHAYKPNIQVTSDGVVYAYAGGTEPGSNFSVLRQFIEDYSFLAGKTVTLSTIVNGTLYKATGVFPSAAGDPSISIFLGTGITMYVAFQTGQNYPKVSITNYSTTSITIRAIKLELGSISTLAMDTAPNYQQELAKCQRYYFQPINGGDGRTCYQFIALNTNSGSGFTFPVRMRAKPTAVKINSIYSYGNMSPVTLTNVGCSVNEDGIKYFTDQSNGFTAGTVYVVDFTASADL